jgi:Zn-dependent protease
VATNSISLGRFFGVEVRVDASWLFIALLFGWSFYLQFEAQLTDLDPMANLLLSAASVFVFFASVLAHELSHSVMARRLGIPVEDITLFLFGGVTKTRMEASRPRDEFLISIVGPPTSVGIAGLLFVALPWLSEVVSEPVLFAMGYIAWLNLCWGSSTSSRGCLSTGAGCSARFCGRPPGVSPVQPEGRPERARCWLRC